MSLDQIAIVMALIIALAGVCYGADQKIERTDAEAARDDAIARAEAAEKIIDRDLHLKGCTCKTTADLERHIDEALEAAEPTPTFRRVK